MCFISKYCMHTSACKIHRKVFLEADVLNKMIFIREVSNLLICTVDDVMFFLN